MSTEKQHTTHHRLVEEVWNQGNLAVADEIFSADYKHHTRSHGLEDEKQFIATYQAAFPDIHFTIEDQFSSGDKTVTRWTARGTHTGELAGLPPTGKQVTVTGILIGRHADGKLVEQWGMFDRLGLLQQIGALPESLPGHVG